MLVSESFYAPHPRSEWSWKRETRIFSHFQSSIDHILRYVDELSDASYEIDVVTKIRILAYADDIITFASSREEAAKQAECVVEMLQMIGMDINMDKCVCAAFDVHPEGDSSSEGRVLSDLCPIPIITYNDEVHFKYLGCEINASGRADCSEWSQNVARNVSRLISSPFFIFSHGKKWNYYNFMSCRNFLTNPSLKQKISRGNNSLFQIC